ncbi:MAG: PAS domain S-box protein [Nitrospinae bacterium]|nr:PAS domain S-box protein [Nitrospinota bacterium]
MPIFDQLLSGHRGDGEAKTLRARVESLEKELEQVRHENTGLNDRLDSYKDILENLRDYVYTMTRDGIFTSLTPAFHKITGWPVEEWIGKNFNGLVHPDDMEKARVNLQRVQEMEAPPVNELRIRNKSGQVLILEFKGMLIKNARGEEEIFGVARDVTERKATEAALKASEEKYKDLFLNANDLLYSHDLEGRFTTINKACVNVLGFGEDEVIGSSISMVVPPEHLKTTTESIQKKLKGEAISTLYELEVVAKNGKRIPVELSTRLIWSDGKPVGVQGIGRDMTERKKAEAELKQAKELAEDATMLKDKFVSLVSHDLRSPMATVIGILNFILGEPAMSEEDRATLMKRALNTCDDLLKMTDQLLNISRMNMGKIRLNRRLVNARALAQATAASVSFQAERKGISINVDIPETLKIYGDMALIHEVLLNLISNAVKFCAKGDRVVIHSPGPNLLCVKDTGPGVLESLKPDLFRHETKTSTSGSSGERGAGFGLPLCMDIMKAHGGTIQLESEPGKGSSFCMDMGPSQPLILIVDDSDVMRQTLRIHLGKMGAQTVEAEDGDLALKLLEERTPDLIISDVHMPSLDGLGLLKRIKDMPKLKDTPVIVITSDSDVETREQVFRLGAADFLTKPVEESDFIPRVGRFIM